jgi:hypothetical protein
MNEQATITKLVGVVDKATGELKQKNPRFLPKNTTAVVEIKTLKPLCIESYKGIAPFCRACSRSLRSIRILIWGRFQGARAVHAALGREDGGGGYRAGAQGPLAEMMM